MPAYFRWKNRQDTAENFTIELWIAHPVVKNSPGTMPDTAAADVTLRRLQKFSVKPGTNYRWQALQGGRPIRSGSVQPDAANLLTIPGLTLTTTPLVLTLQVH